MTRAERAQYLGFNLGLMIPGIALIIWSFYAPPASSEWILFTIVAISIALLAWQIAWKVRLRRRQPNSGQAEDR